MLKLSFFTTIVTIATVEASWAENQNNWTFHKITESMIISEYWVPDGILEAVKAWVMSEDYRPGIMISCNQTPIDTPIGLIDFQKGRYGTLNFSVPPGNTKIAELFTGVKWEERGDSFKEFQTHITVHGITSVDLEARALIDDDLDIASIWIFAEYIPQMPFLIYMASDEFSVTVKGPYGDETLHFDPDNAASEWTKFLLVCDQVP